MAAKISSFVAGNDPGALLECTSSKGPDIKFIWQSRWVVKLRQPMLLRSSGTYFVEK